MTTNRLHEINHNLERSTGSCEMKADGSNAPGASRIWRPRRITNTPLRAEGRQPNHAARKWPNENDLSPNLQIVRKLSSVPKLDENALKRIDNYERLKSRLRNEKPAIRIDAAYDLGNTKDPLVMSLLYEMLFDKNADVRGAAAESLGMLGTAARPTASKLLSMFRNRNEEFITRAKAGGSLGDIGYSKAVPALIRSLENWEDEGMHSSITWSLCQLRDRRALPALEMALRLCGEGMYGAMEQYVRENAEKAIAKIEGKADPPVSMRSKHITNSYEDDFG